MNAGLALSRTGDGGWISLKDSGGTGFWHETYFMRGGIEGIYDDMTKPTGLARFAPTQPARGAMFSARLRAGRGDALTVPPVVSEEAYYGLAEATEPNDPGGTPAA